MSQKSVGKEGRRRGKVGGEVEADASKASLQSRCPLGGLGIAALLPKAKIPYQIN
jgi:hypothetical protein